MRELALLKKWLKKPGNNELKIAAMLGYRTPNTIKKWIKNKHIPNFRIEQVRLICRG